MISLALLVSFGFEGSRGLYETTEGRYAECAREMIETGNYLEPTLGYRSHWSKPPLTYWAIASGIKIIGANEWGVRLYNAMAFFLTVLAIDYLGAVLWDKTTGLVAGLIYLSSPFPVIGAYVASTDTLLTLWEICAVLCYIKTIRNRSEAGKKNWIVAMWLFFGLGFLTKGPPALLPLFPILVSRFRTVPHPKIANPLGLLIFALTGLSWYVAVCFRHPDLLSYFLGTEIIARVSSDAVHNHEWYQPFVIYLPLLTLGAGPWLYFGLEVLKQKKLINPTVLWSYLRSKSISSFLLLWLLLPLILLSLVKSRLPLYVLPLYAPIALATARWICKFGDRISNLRRIFLVALISGLLLMGIKGVADWYPDKKNMKPLYEMSKAVGQNHARFIVFNEAKLYGLQFYLNGNLERVTETGREPWSEGSVEAIIRKMKNSAPTASYVFISNKKQSPTLDKILQNSFSYFQRYNNDYWYLYLIDHKVAHKSKVFY